MSNHQGRGHEEASTFVVEAVHPSVGPGRELTVFGPDVVGLAEVVPGDDLDEAHFVAARDDVLPTRDVEMLIAIVDELCSGEDGAR